MTKYWDSNRLRRDKERKIRSQNLSAERSSSQRERLRSYTVGDAQKNAQLILNALGLPMRLRMLALLVRGGAMSISKLAKPFRLSLPTALEHVRILERSGLITTHKQGRVRMCVYNSISLRELSHWLKSDGLKHIK